MGSLLSLQEGENLDEPDDSNKTEPKGPEEEEMLNLSILPLDLQHRIVEKMKYREYAILDESSVLGHHICATGNYSLPFRAESVYVNKSSMKVVEWYTDWGPFFIERRKIPWHAASRPPVRIVSDIVRIECQATSNRIQAVSKLFESNHTKVDTISITRQILFQPEDFERLLKACNPSTLHSRVFLPREFFTCPSIQNMSTMELDTTGCTNDEFLKLKVDEYLTMKNNQITAKGLNKFLKQWKNKEREIFAIKIEFDNPIGTEAFDKILEGLGANPIWTPDLHEDSLIGRIPIEELSQMRNGDPVHFYCMWRPEEPEDTIFIFLWSRGIEIRELYGEADFMYCDLDPSQYNLLLGVCVECGTRFCKHMRRFSTARLKKNIPTFYSALINVVKTLSIASATGRMIDFMLGERPFAPISRLDFEIRRKDELYSAILLSIEVFLDETLQFPFVRI